MLSYGQIVTYEINGLHGLGAVVGSALIVGLAAIVVAAYRRSADGRHKSSVTWGTWLAAVSMCSVLLSFAWVPQPEFHEEAAVAKLEEVLALRNVGLVNGNFKPQDAVGDHLSDTAPEFKGTYYIGEQDEIEVRFRAVFTGNGNGATRFELLSPKGSLSHDDLYRGNSPNP